MDVDRYEKIWMVLAAVMIAAFLAAIAAVAGSHAVKPPSHVETIDPETVAESAEFGSPSVTMQPDGSIRVSGVAQTFSFEPDPIQVTAGRPVTFRLTSPDVIHGFEIVGTNANAMVVPGYVSSFTVTFPRAGTYMIACNEYCGLLHHNMIGHVIVEEPTP